MNICDFENIQPFVRMVKIKKSLHLQGDWEDLDHVMIYIAHGSVVYGVSGHSYLLNTGDIILLPPLMHHCLFNQSQDNLVQYILHFDFFTNPVRKQIPHQSAADLTPKPENSAEYEKKSKPWMLVKSTMEYIWLHYSEHMDNSSIAEAINVSPNYLTKIFRQHVGSSLHKYITSYRLEQAQQMLMSGKYNITEVSQKCGFSSIHIFSKLFIISEYRILSIQKNQEPDKSSPDF